MIFIFLQCLNRVSREGMAIITSYSEMEHRELMGLLQSIPCTVLQEFKNEHAMTLDYTERFSSFDDATRILGQEEDGQETGETSDGPAFDKFVVLAKKSES